MTTFNVPDMHCQMCVDRITKALSAAGLSFRVDLAAKTVSVDDCPKCDSAAKAAELLDDLGFTPAKL